MTMSGGADRIPHFFMTAPSNSSLHPLRHVIREEVSSCQQTVGKVCLLNQEIQTENDSYKDFNNELTRDALDKAL